MEKRLRTTVLASGYRTIDGSADLKPYSTIHCNVTVTHNENASRLSRNILNVKENHKPKT